MPITREMQRKQYKKCSENIEPNIANVIEFLQRKDYNLIEVKKPKKENPRLAYNN